MPPLVATTLGQLRRDIASRLGDYVPLTATSDGTDVIFRSAVDLAVPFDAYRGRQIVITSGHADNVGVIRRVANNSPAEGGRLSVTPPAPRAMAAGTTAELYDAESISYRIEQIHAAINRAIRMAGDDACLPDSATVTATADGTGLTVPVPEGWVYLNRVQLTSEWGATGGGWADVRVAQREEESGWWVVNAGMPDVAVVIRSGPAWSWPYGRTAQDGTTDEMSVRLEGLTLPQPLVGETDATGLDYEWLVERALSELQVANARTRNDRQAEERIGLIREQTAERLRQQGVVRNILPRNARRVR